MESEKAKAWSDAPRGTSSTLMWKRTGVPGLMRRFCERPWSWKMNSG